MHCHRSLRTITPNWVDGASDSAPSSQAWESLLAHPDVDLRLQELEAKEENLSQLLKVGRR